MAACRPWVATLLLQYGLRLNPRCLHPLPMYTSHFITAFKHSRTGKTIGVASFVHPSADLCTELASMSRALIPFGIALKMTHEQKRTFHYTKTQGGTLHLCASHFQRLAYCVRHRHTPSTQDEPRESWILWEIVSALSTTEPLVSKSRDEGEQSLWWKRMKQ